MKGFWIVDGVEVEDGGMRGVRKKVYSVRSILGLSARIMF